MGPSAVKKTLWETIKIDDPESSLCTWLKSLYEDCQLHDRSLTQLLSIIVNFDECVIQYKYIPQRSYVGRHHEIRAKTSNRAGITGLFGATATGRKFKANLTYTQWL